jgi:hypothetical protein
MRPPFFHDFEIELQRARQQLGIFNTEVDTFHKSEPQRIVPKLISKGNGLYEVVILLQVVRWPPPELGILAGEVVFHLRNCLDHIVYELSLRRGMPETELHTTEFPIFIDPGRFSELRSSGRQKEHPAPRSGLYRIRFVQPAVQAIIKGLQPYHAGQNAMLHPLWILHELSNISKHRRLHLFGNPFGQVSLLDTFGPFDVLETEVCMERPLRSETIISKVLIKERLGFQRNVRVRQKVPPHVAFDESTPLPQKYAGEILQDITLFVDNDVISQLKPYLQ